MKFGGGFTLELFESGRILKEKGVNLSKRSICSGQQAWDLKKESLMLTFGFCLLLGSRYHTGSLAFGSLILSLVQVIRVILEYLDQKLKG